jgi:hypothetical protein
MTLTPCSEKGLCEVCCEYSLSDEDLKEMAKLRGYRLVKGKEGEK